MDKAHTGSYMATLQLIQTQNWLTKQTELVRVHNRYFNMPEPFLRHDHIFKLMPHPSSYICFIFSKEEVLAASSKTTSALWIEPLPLLQTTTDKTGKTRKTQSCFLSLL